MFFVRFVVSYLLYFAFGYAAVCSSSCPWRRIRRGPIQLSAPNTAYKTANTGAVTRMGRPSDGRAAVMRSHIGRLDDEGPFAPGLAA